MRNFDKYRDINGTREYWYFWSELYQKWGRCHPGTALHMLAKGRPIRLGLDGLENEYQKYMLPPAENSLNSEAA